MMCTGEISLSGDGVLLQLGDNGGGERCDLVSSVVYGDIDSCTL